MAAVAVGIVAAIAGGAFADNLQDSLAVTSTNNFSPTINEGQSFSTTINYVVQKTGANNTTFPATVNFAPTGAPSWVSLSDSSFSFTGYTDTHTLTVSGTAPSGSHGSYTFTVDASTSADNLNANAGDQSITVTVNAPVATNHAPSTPGAPTVAAGTSPRANGSFTVSWTASTDPDSSDTVSYTLEQHNASTSTWSSVASGLTTNSYTFGGSNAAEGEGTWSYRVKATDNHGLDSAGYGTSSDLVKVDESNPNNPAVSSPTSAPYNDGTSNWYEDSVTVSFAANGDATLADSSAGSGVASVTGSQTYDSTNADPTTGAFSLTGIATDNVGNQSSPGTTVSGKVDWKNPTVSITSSTPSVYTDGSGNWWKDSVSLSVSASDPAPASGLAIDPSISLGSFTTSGSVAAGTYTATDNVGHSDSNAAFNYKVDAQAPTFGACSGGQFTLNSGTKAVSITAQDEAGGSGLDTADSTLSGSVDTSSNTQQSVTFTAEDNVGHSVQKTCNYDIVSGTFLSPIDAAPVMNIAKLGRVVPVKSVVSLDGTPVSAGTVYVAGATQVSCTDGSGGLDDIEVYAAGSSNTGNLFRYDTTGQYWIYNFDTSAFSLKAGNCYKVSVYYGGTVTNGNASGGTLAGSFLIKTTK